MKGTPMTTAELPDLMYDRTVSDDFHEHFRPGGFAASLVEYAKARYPMDLQMRKNPKPGGHQWATLYVGMTAVINVVDHGVKGLALTANSKYAVSKLEWRPGWAEPRHSQDWQVLWRDVESYLERVIPFVIESRRLVATEGLVQAAVTNYAEGGERVVLDREVTPHFRDTATKETIRQLYSAELVQALASVPGVKGRPPVRFGMKCDLLAVDADGRLLAIEVKPGSVGSLAWVAAQATMYAKVLQHWIDESEARPPSDRWPSWRDIVTTSFEQRKLLGLTPAGFSLPALQPEVIPAVAYQRIAHPTYLDRMRAVQTALLNAGVGDPRLKFYEVSLSGRLDEWAGA